MGNWKPLCTELQISEFDTYDSSFAKNLMQK